MDRYLIVANQTLGGSELEEKIQSRMGLGGSFYVVVPMIEPEAEASAWVPADPAFGVGGGQRPIDEDAQQEARRRSEHRLNRMLDKIRALGGEAEGEIGSSDPVEAVKSALERDEFNEVIVSTLPVGISRWLKMDIPSRIDRLADCPVTTVEADA